MPTSHTRRRRPRLLGALPIALAAACGGPSLGTPPAAPPAPAVTSCCAPLGAEVATRWRASGFTNRHVRPAELQRLLDGLRDAPALRIEEVGRSVHGRPISSVTFGRGPTTVLLWSQMHGDEPTATMALADILTFLARGEGDALRRRLEERLTVVMVPMLNPDGAELNQRENAVGVDVNRDARALATPEGQALKRLHDRLRPDFGFNLHDQGARTLAGRGGQQVAIALLAPAADAQRSWGPVRTRARLVAATIAAALEAVDEGALAGRVAKYDDGFNARAFGDLVQQWGTSTVLIESGALPDDPQKQQLRHYNVVAILTALDAIATGAIQQADPQRYERLPYNERIATDVLVRGAQVVLPDRAPMRLDVALTFDDAVARTGPRLREVGDLQGTAALDTIAATGLFLHPEPGMLGPGRDPVLRIGAPAAFTLRRGAEASSAVVQRVGG